MSLFKGRSYNRVMVFIDYRNLMAKYNEGDLVTDIFRLTKILVGERELVGAYIFDGRMTNGDQRPEDRLLLSNLRSMGFRVITRDSVVFRDGHYVQKEVDVSLSVEMLEHALLNHYDVAILISGDRDFIPAIQKVQAAGKKVEVASYEDFISGDREIQFVADVYHKLREIPFLEMSSPPADGGQ